MGRDAGDKPTMDLKVVAIFAVAAASLLGICIYTSVLCTCIVHASNTFKLATRITVDPDLSLFLKGVELDLELPQCFLQHVLCTCICV